jgi:uncharacterized protein YuzE
MQKFNFSYDKGNDDLFVFIPRFKSKGSVEVGDVVLDFNSKKEVVGIQIMHASRMIKDMTDENMSSIRNLLRDLRKCEFEVKPRNNMLFIRIFLFSEMKEISSVIPVPNITQPSPALASA